MSRILHLTLAGILAVAVVLAGPGRPAEAFVPLAIPLTIAGKALIAGGAALLGGAGITAYWLYGRDDGTAPSPDDPLSPQFAPELLLTPEALAQDTGADGSVIDGQFPYLTYGPDIIANLTVTVDGPGVARNYSGPFWGVFVPVTVSGYGLQELGSKAFRFVGLEVLSDGQWFRCDENLAALVVHIGTGPFGASGEIRCRNNNGSVSTDGSVRWVHTEFDPSYIRINDGTGFGSSFLSRYDAVQAPTLVPEPAFRVTQTELECYDPVTDSVTTVTHTSDPYPATAETIVPTPMVLCPEGTVPKRLTVTSEPDVAGGSVGPTHNLFTWEQDGLLLEPTHPLLDCLVDPTLCTLRVVRIDTGTQPEECVPKLENCHGWWDDPLRGQKYRCYWGDFVRPLTDCYELQRAYNRAPTNTPITTIPMTPLQPGEGIIPNAPPTTTLLPPPTLTPPVTIEPPTTEQPGTEDGCLATGLVAWNPVTWVYAPVKCALQWAFVPSAATIGLITSTGDAFAGKAPFSFFGDASGWLAPLQGVGSQCLLIQGTVVGHPLTVVDSCTPGPVEAHIMSWRPWLLIVVHAWVMVPLMWWAWRAYMPGAQGVA